ncbi:T9SS type A sorting domain-containing protein [bacterium]|nr:T9SS type A sorting domain-containing protein [bacterium]
MKRMPLLLLAVLLGWTSATRAQHFDPVDPTGLPWAIVVMSAEIGEDSLAIGDEVAAYDGDLCVGAATVDGEWPLALTCWEGDPGFELEGFTTGNLIQYRYWIASDQAEMDGIDATYDSGNTTFGSGTHAAVHLWAPSLAVPGSVPDLPRETILSAYPNPFNAATTITLTLPVAGEVELLLFDTLGRHITTLHHTPLASGQHRFSWSGHGLPSGIYFLRLHAPNNILLTQKLVLLN